MAANTLNINANFHTTALTTVYLAVGWFGTDHKFRANAGLFNNVLPAQTVAVFFLHSTGDQQGIFIFQTEIFNDFSGIYHRRHAAFLVGSTATTDQLISFHAFVRIEVPVFDVANADCIDMSVHCHQTRAVADITENIAHWVDFNFIEADFFHLFFNTMYYAFLVAAFTGNSNHIAQEASHVRLVIFCFFKNQFEWNILSHYFSPDFLLPVLQGAVPIG